MLAAIPVTILAVVVSIPGSSLEGRDHDPVPEYEELEELPRIVVEPSRSVTERRVGMEWSSVASFDGDLLLLDDRKGPVEPAAESRPVLAPESRDAKGLVLFRIDTESEPVKLERAWVEPFRRDVALRNHRYSNLEAMASLGPHLYLLGSHAPRRDGSFDRDRQVAIRLTAGPRRVAEWKEIRLRDALASLTAEIPELAASVATTDVDPHQREEQIDIQGLARLPGSEDLLVGLRNPHVSVPGSDDPRCRDAAVVLRLHGPDRIFDADERPRLSAHAFLCLSDRGVAGLAFDPASGSYLVAVSRMPGGKGPTSLWQWDPRPCARPPLRELMRFSHLRLEGVTRIESGRLRGKLALAFDSHYYAGARRARNTNEGSFVVIDQPLDSMCE